MAAPSTENKCDGCWSHSEREAVYISFWVFAAVALLSCIAYGMHLMGGLKKHKWLGHPANRWALFALCGTTAGLGVWGTSMYFCAKGCDQNYGNGCSSATKGTNSATSDDDKQASDGGANSMLTGFFVFLLLFFWFLSMGMGTSGAAAGATLFS